MTYITLQSDFNTTISDFLYLFENNDVGGVKNLQEINRRVIYGNTQDIYKTDCWLFCLDEKIQGVHYVVSADITFSFDSLPLKVPCALCPQLCHNW